MANKTILDFDAVGDPQPDDVLYLKRGTGASSDRQVSVATLLSGVKSELSSAVAGVSNIAATLPKVTAALRSLETNQWGPGSELIGPQAQTGRATAFGCAVAVDGDHAIVGLYREDVAGVRAGAAYIFSRTGANTWDSGTRVVAPDGAANEQFGWSVSIDGDYAIVGANLEIINGGSSTGAAYVFRRTGPNSWDDVTKLVASDGQAMDGFGWSVDIDGDYAVAGARLSPGNESRGSAYVFHRTGLNEWDSGAKLTQPNPIVGDFFGSSVSISGDYVIAGSWGDDTAALSAGAAWVFRRAGTNTWDGGTRLLAPDAAQSDHFGYSVAIDGEYAIVGAYQEDPSDVANAGSAYVYRRIDANTWNFVTKLLAPDRIPLDNFGWSVAIDGDYAIVSASNRSGSVPHGGRAYIFRRTGLDTWDEGTRLTAPYLRSQDQFGLYVAISGTYAMVGARGDVVDTSFPTDTFEVAAYIYGESFQTTVSQL